MEGEEKHRATRHLVLNLDVSDHAWLFGRSLPQLLYLYSASVSSSHLSHAFHTSPSIALRFFLIILLWFPTFYNQLWS